LFPSVVYITCAIPFSTSTRRIGSDIFLTTFSVQAFRTCHKHNMILVFGHTFLQCPIKTHDEYVDSNNVHNLYVQVLENRAWTRKEQEVSARTQCNSILPWRNRQPLHLDATLVGVEPPYLGALITSTIYPPQRICW
jgi:hypothetical protein